MCPTLENGICNPLLLRTGTISSKDPWNWLVDLDESRFSIDDMEFMFVA